MKIFFNRFYNSATIFLPVLPGPGEAVINSWREVFQEEILCSNWHKDTYAVILDDAFSLDREKGVTVTAVGGRVQ